MTTAGSTELTGQTAKEQLANDLSKTIAAYAPFTGYAKDIRRDLMRYSEELLRELSHALPVENDLSRKIKRSIAQSHPEETIREHLAFFPLMPHMSHTFNVDMVAVLHTYPQLPNTTDFTSKGQTVLDQCIALIRVGTEADMLRLDLPESGVEDERLIDLIIEHAESVDHLLSIMNSRHTKDPDLIRDVLNAPVTALSSGVI